MINGMPGQGLAQAGSVLYTQATPAHCAETLTIRHGITAACWLHMAVHAGHAVCPGMPHLVAVLP